MIEMIRGDTKYITVNITDEDGNNYLVATDDECLFTVKKSYTDETILIEKDVTSDGNKNYFKLEPSDTSTLDFGAYVYDVQLTQANGDVSTIIEPSQFLLKPEVTWQ